MNYWQGCSLVVSGCHIGPVYSGAVRYANDVTLIAPSLHNLNVMLDIRKNSARSCDVTFNPKEDSLH